jgi:chitinase
MPSFAWLAFLLAGTVVVDATQVMHKPSTFRDAPRSANTTRDPIVHHVHRRSATGKTQMAYFTNW